MGGWKGGGKGFLRITEQGFFSKGEYFAVGFLGGGQIGLVAFREGGGGLILRIYIYIERRKGFR